MNPKKKAEELVEKYQKIKHSVSNHMQSKRSVQCSIIAVDEIIAAFNNFGYIGAMYNDFETGRIVTTDEILPETFWNEVKNELNKML